jgi:Uma2 family endonuclease
MPETATLLTAEEFLADPAYEGWELIDGVPKETIVPYGTNRVTMIVGYLILAFLERAGIAGGVASPEQRFKMWPNRPNLVRKPDVTYFAPGRVPEFSAGDLDVAPDLVVEVVSTHEDAEDVEQKRVQYLEAGVPLLWVIYPLTRTVHVYGKGGLVEVLAEGDTLTGGSVLPGFAVPVASLFPR